MFDELLTILNENRRGIHAYRKCADKAFERASDEPENATAYFLLGAAAEDFVSKNERMPLSTKDAEVAFSQFSDFVGQLETSLASSSPDEMLQTLNAIAGKLVGTR